MWVRINYDKQKLVIADRYVTSNSGTDMPRTTAMCKAGFLTRAQNKHRESSCGGDNQQQPMVA